MSRGTWDTVRVSSDFVYAAITLYGRPFQTVRLSSDNPMLRSRNPEHTTDNNHNQYFDSVIIGCVLGLGCSLFARRYWGNLCFDLCSCRSLDVSVPCVSFVRLCIQRTITRLSACWVAPFGNLRIKALLAAPRSLSQLDASFIASERQGIHHMPLVA